MKLMAQEALSRCNFIINQSDDPMRICCSVIDVLERLLSYRRGCVVVKRLSDSRPLVFCHSNLGIGSNNIEKDLFTVNNLLGMQNTGVINSVIKSGNSIIVSDVRQYSNYSEGCADMKSEVCVPLIVGGRTFGAFNFESWNLGFFDDQDALLLQSLANQIAFALDRTDLPRAFEETRVDQIRAAGLIPDQLL